MLITVAFPASSPVARSLLSGENSMPTRQSCIQHEVWCFKVPTAARDRTAQPRPGTHRSRVQKRSNGPAGSVKRVMVRLPAISQSIKELGGSARAARRSTPGSSYRDKRQQAMDRGAVRRSPCLRFGPRSCVQLLAFSAEQPADDQPATGRKINDVGAAQSLTFRNSSCIEPLHSREDRSRSSGSALRLNASRT